MRGKQCFFDNVKVVLERLQRREQEEAKEEVALWGRLKTPGQRLNNYSFGSPWLLVDFVLASACAGC